VRIRSFEFSVRELAGSMGDSEMLLSLVMAYTVVLGFTGIMDWTAKLAADAGLTMHLAVPATSVV
jgi:hypothetical protein